MTEWRNDAEISADQLRRTVLRVRGDIRPIGSHGSGPRHARDQVPVLGTGRVAVAAAEREPRRHNPKREPIMGITQLPPAHDLAKRLSTLEQQVQSLATRDVLKNASIGSDGLTVYGGQIHVTQGRLAARR
ncbi:hypothetical protein GCM10028798_19640 [Humibacter antri]